MTMNRRFAWITAAISLSVAVGLAGEDAAANRPMRIGVVRVQDVFKEYEYAKDQEAQIKGEFDKDKNAIDALEKQIQAKVDALKTDPLRGPNNREWKLDMLEIKRLEIELDEHKAKFNREARKRMAEFYRSIYAHFRTVVQEVGDKYQYDLIITAPTPDLSKEGEGADNPEAIRTEILLRRVQYIGSRQGVDITHFIVSTMNKRYAEMKEKGQFPR